MGAESQTKKTYEYDRASTPTIREEPEAESEERETVEQFSLEQGMSASPMANYHAHPPELSASPSPAQTQSQSQSQSQPKHRPQSASVVFHDNIRDSQIYDNGEHDEDEEEDEDSHSRSGHEYES